MRSLVLVTALASGCTTGRHLTYDHGRAYSASLSVQADLTRPSVAHEEYFLSGLEGIALRQRATEVTTDEESGEAELIRK